MGLPEKWNICSRTISVGDVAFFAYWRDTIAVHSKSYGILLLDAITGSRKAVLTGHTKSVQSLTFSQDGTLLVSGSFDKTVRLWDIQTGGLIKTFHCTELICTVAISPDCTIIASGGSDGTVCLWNTQTRKSHSNKIHEHRVTAVSFSPINSQHLVSSSLDGTVQQCDMDGKQVGTPYCEASELEDAAYAPDGSHFISCGGTVATVRDSKSGAVVTKLNAPLDRFHCCCFSPDGKFVACGAGSTIYIWCITSSEAHLVGKLAGHSGDIQSIVFSSSSIISGSADQSVRIWQSSSLLQDSALTGSVPIPPASASITSVNISAEDGIIITSDSSGMVETWDLTTGAHKSSSPTPAQGIWDAHMAGDTLIIAWNPEGQQEYHIWDVRKSQLLNTVDSRLVDIKDLKISGDGSKIFGLDYYSAIEASSLETGEVLLYAGGMMDGEEGNLVVDGSKVWIENSTGMGWDFRGKEVSTFSLSNRFPDGSHLHIIHQSTQGSTKPAWIQNTSSGDVVFCLSEGHTGPDAKKRLDGWYLSVISPSGELVVMDFSSVCSK